MKDTLNLPTLTTSEKPLSKVLNLDLSHWSPPEQVRVCGGAAGQLPFAWFELHVDSKMNICVCTFIGQILIKEKKKAVQ